MMTLSEDLSSGKTWEVMGRSLNPGLDGAQISC